MSHSIDVYKLVKMYGYKLEYKINSSIQAQLNQGQFLRQFGSQSKAAAAVIKRMQNTVEALSIPLNFPTKKDVANATKINIQMEEKIDLIDEKVNTLLTSLKDLKQSKGGRGND